MPARPLGYTIPHPAVRVAGGGGRGSSGGGGGRRDPSWRSGWERFVRARAPPSAVLFWKLWTGGMAFGELSIVLRVGESDQRPWTLATLKDNIDAGYEWR